MTDEDIRKYVDLFIKEEVQNGRGPEDLRLKDTIEVYHMIYGMVYGMRHGIRYGIQYGIRYDIRPISHNLHDQLI